MPVTPFHMGPAVIVKAVLREKFSLTIFGFSQILIDLQPLLVLFGADFELHGISHTLIGASVIAAVAALSGKPLCEFFLRWWNRHLSAPNSQLLYVNETISWWVVISSALIGTYSHLLRDSIMHTEVIPFYPLHTNNSLWGLVSVDKLHIYCVIAGVIGMIGYWLITRQPTKP